MQKYCINSDSIIFLDGDADNAFTSIIYDWGNEEIIKIYQPMYEVLYYIFLHHEVDQKALSQEFKFHENRQLEELFNNLISKRIIMRYDNE